MAFLSVSGKESVLSASGKESVEKIGMVALHQDSLRTEVGAARDGNEIVDTVRMNDFSHQETTSRYDKRIHRYRKDWGALVPTQMVLQTCGNMGLFSIGMGWDYGKRRQWETELMFGVIPKYDSHSVKMTMTLKENFIPWSINLKKGWAFEPLECTLYFNTVFGHDFWTKQPTKYDSGYYPFSTRIRPNIALGERIYKEIPKNKRKFIKGFYFFYELGTTDIYFMQFYRNGGKSEFWDIVGLSLGLKAQLF